MATLRNKGKLVALNKENCEELPRRNWAQNSNVPRSQEEYITQISEEIEGRVTKLSQGFSRMENRILGALSCFVDFLKNLLIQGHSGNAREMSQSAYGSNQGTNEDDCQSDPHPEAGIFQRQNTHNSGPEDGHDMVTRVHEELTYCSPTTFSGNQKTNHSTSQLQFRSENTSAMIEADQILLALQQLANNNTSSSFPNNLSRNSKLPKSLTTTRPTFDGKSDKFELLQDLFLLRRKIHNQLTEDDRIN